MFDFLKRALTPPEQHEACETHRYESAALRAEMHQLYDRNRQMQNQLSQLQAENLRLSQANTALRMSQKDSLIEELADRLLEHKATREAPALTIPCPHHRSAEITFAPA